MRELKLVIQKLIIGLAGIFLLIVFGGCEKEKSVTGPTTSNKSDSSINNVAVANKSTCTEAKGIYNATQCGSVRSDVGTPPYPCCDNNYNNKATDSDDGNCTWYVWYKAKKMKGWNVPSSWGGAGSWCTNAEISGWGVSNTPEKNTIACSSSLGHVAWVYDVSLDKKTIYVEEMNCRVPSSCFGSGLRYWSHDASKFRYISLTPAIGYRKYAKSYRGVREALASPLNIFGPFREGALHVIFIRRVGD